MKHIISEGSVKYWKYDTELFSRYKVSLRFGATHFDDVFLPVQQLETQPLYMVRARQRIYYLGGDQEKASRIAADPGVSADVSEAHLGVLPENKFVLQQTDKGFWEVVPGEDESKDILIFTGIDGGFRGSCNTGASSTAQVLMEAWAGNACESRTECAAWIKPGQCLGMCSTGRGGTLVEAYFNNDGGLEQKEFNSVKEWEAFMGV